MVTWKATTNSDTQQRIVIQVEGDWLVADDALAHDDRDWTLDIPDDYEETWTRDDGRGMFTVTFEDLMKALEVRVDARRGDDSDWVNGATGSVEAES